MKIFDLNEVNEAKGAAKQKEIKFLFVERSATNQSIKHTNQSKTFDWMIEFDWIWLIAAPFALSSFKFTNMAGMYHSDLIISLASLIYDPTNPADYL